MPTTTLEPPATEIQERATRDLHAFREFLKDGAPGPHAYATLLGLRTYDLTRLMRQIQRGLPYSAFDHLHRNLGVPVTEAAELVQISPRTIARRREEGRFSAEESDRLLRAARLLGRTLELFEGDAEAASRWLSSAQPALGGAIPLTIARSELGTRAVEAIIDRLEYGVFS